MVMQHWHDVSLLNSALRTSKEILSTNFYEGRIEPKFISEACFIFLMINLRDALLILDKLGRRINFTDDLPEDIDITEAIRQMRNSTCHLGSPSRQVDANGNILSYCRMSGAGVLAQINDVIISNEYMDDVAFFYGKQKLLLNRHLKRACDEAIVEAENFAQSVGLHWFPFE